MFSHISLSAGLFLVFLYMGLIAGSVFVHKNKASLSNYAELKSRILSWWVIITLVSLALLSHFYIAVGFFAFLSLIALGEYLKISPTRKSDVVPLLCTLCAILVQYYLVAIGWYGLFIVFIPVYMYFLLAMSMVLTGNTQDFLKSLSILQWGMMVAIFSLSHLAFLLILPVYKSGNLMDTKEGIGLVLFILFTVQFNDVAQYIWGKKFGKHKILPTISPNKTWQGFLGGMLTTVVLSVIVGLWLTPMTFYFAVMMGILLSIAGFFGDVVISAIKRDLHIKDTGHLLPGHGGILDRIDSLTFSVPLFFHLIRYFYF